MDLPTAFVIDHLGLVRPDDGVEGAQFQTLLELLDSGRGWVKLSGPMRVSRERKMPYGDTPPLYQALVEHNPQRLVWTGPTSTTTRASCRTMAICWI